MKNYIITITFLLSIFKPLYSQESKKYLDYQAIKKWQDVTTLSLTLLKLLIILMIHHTSNLQTKLLMPH